MSILTPFALTYSLVESTRMGWLGFVNARLFGTVDDSTAAAVYGASSTLIHYSIFIGAAALTSMMASQALHGPLAHSIQNDPSQGLIINLGPLGIEMLSAGGSTLMAYPLAWGVSAVGGRAIANLVKEGRPLSYREIAKLELMRITERFTFGL